MTQEHKQAPAIRYLIQHMAKPPAVMVEALYVADVMHLHRWGRLITQPHYLAARKGVLLPSWPVTHELAEADLDDLSVSDTMMLDEAMALVRNGGIESLTRHSKDGAWRAARTRAESDEVVPITLEDMARTSPDADALLSHLRRQHPRETSVPGP